jgi:hypothetical protein
LFPYSLPFCSSYPHHFLFTFGLNWFEYDICRRFLFSLLAGFVRVCGVFQYFRRIFSHYHCKYLLCPILSFEIQVVHPLHCLVLWQSSWMPWYFLTFSSLCFSLGHIYWPAITFFTFMNYLNIEYWPISLAVSNLLIVVPKVFFILLLSFTFLIFTFYPFYSLYFSAKIPPLGMQD